MRISAIVENFRFSFAENSQNNACCVYAQRVAFTKNVALVLQKGMVPLQNFLHIQRAD